MFLLLTCSFSLNACLSQDVCESQEAWWLRKGCRRARCRLIKKLADAFGIPVKHMQVCLFILFCAGKHAFMHMRVHTLFYFALEHVLDREGLHDGAPEAAEQRRVGALVVAVGGSKQ